MHHNGLSRFFVFWNKTSLEIDSSGLVEQKWNCGLRARFWLAGRPRMLRGCGCCAPAGALRQRRLPAGLRRRFQRPGGLKKGGEGKKEQPTGGEGERTAAFQIALPAAPRPGPFSHPALPCPGAAERSGARALPGAAALSAPLRPAPAGGSAPPRARYSGSGAAQPSSGNSWQPQPVATAEGEPGRGRLPALPQRSCPPSLLPSLAAAPAEGGAAPAPLRARRGRQGALCASGRRCRPGRGRGGARAAPSRERAPRARLSAGAAECFGVFSGFSCCPPAPPIPEPLPRPRSSSAGRNGEARTALGMGAAGVAGAAPAAPRESPRRPPRTDPYGPAVLWKYMLLFINEFIYIFIQRQLGPSLEPRRDIWRPRWQAGCSEMEAFLRNSKSQKGLVSPSYVRHNLAWKCTMNREGFM